MMLPAGTMPSKMIRASTILPPSTRAQRTSPIPISMQCSGNRVPRALQQHPRLGERQTDDVRIASGDVADIDFAIALQRIPASLAAPLAMAGVIVDLFIAEPLHRDHGLDQPRANFAARDRQRDAGQYS